MVSSLFIPQILTQLVIPPKVDELAALCIVNKPDVVCLVETWLSDDVLDSEVAIHNHSVLGLDRTDMAVV